MDNALLVIALETAVPLWIMQLKDEPWDVIQARMKECGQVIAEQGDLILYRGGRKGETANAFNRLAEAIACLSFAPGGVKAFGRHWEAKHANEADGSGHEG